jgi:hypothetical protein
MFIFKKGSVNVDLFTDHPAFFDHARPMKAAHFIPKWWKKLPSKAPIPEGSLTPKRTMKTCAGFLDLYSSGFIQPLWCDLNIRVTPEGNYAYQFSDEISKAEMHSEYQFEGSPFVNTYTHLKLVSPWVAKSKSESKWLFTNPFWNDFGLHDIYVPQGITRFNTVPVPLNVNLFFRRPETDVVHALPFGLPLVHILPLTDKKITLKHHLVSSTELFNLKYKSAVSLFFSDRFRKASALCPHAK